jgi:hypothetical protein
LHSLLLGSLILFTLLSCQLDFDPVHAPHERDFALSSNHQVVANFIEKVIVSLQPLLGKLLSIDLTDSISDLFNKIWGLTSNLSMISGF